VRRGRAAKLGDDDMTDNRSTGTGPTSNGPTGTDPYANPLARKNPLGGRTGVMIVSIVPLVALVLFLAIGFLAGGWGWAWVFFLAVPIASIVVYGLGNRRS
jgi:ABC-type dipeptide/oligopeptide/nickel transport system permease subunit